jgi:hypothetical protein
VKKRKLQQDAPEISTLYGGLPQALRLQRWIISALRRIDEVHVQLAAAALLGRTVAAFSPQ